MTCTHSVQCNRVMTFEIATAAHIKSPSIPSGVFVLRKEIDSRVFFNLKKTNYMVAKLLTGWCGDEHGDVERKRAIFKTDIIEQIAALRNTLFYQSVFNDDVPSVAKRYASKKLRPLVIQAPETGVLDAPCVGRVGGVQMRVVVNKPNAPVYVELNDANITYLRDAAEVQFTRGDIEPRKHPRLTVPEIDRVEVPGQPGVSFSYARQAFRTDVKDDTGTRRSNYFKTSTLGFTTALEKASARTKLTDYFAVARSQSACGSDNDDPETGDAGGASSDRDEM